MKNLAVVSVLLFSSICQAGALFSSDFLIRPSIEEPTTFSLRKQTASQQQRELMRDRRHAITPEEIEAFKEKRDQLLMGGHRSAALTFGYDGSLLPAIDRLVKLVFGIWSAPGQSDGGQNSQPSTAAASPTHTVRAQIAPSANASNEVVPPVITFGTRNSPDGRYEGDLRNGVRHGKGQLLTQKGASYRGRWENDVFVQGLVRVKGVSYYFVQYPDGYYRGQAEDGLPHGRGIRTNGGLVYDGGWQFGKRQGFGRVTWDGGTFEVRFEDDLAQGDGIIWGIDGSIQRAFWKNGNMDGEWKKTFQDGSTLTGTCDEGTMSPKATFESKEGIEQWEYNPTTKAYERPAQQPQQA